MRQRLNRFRFGICSSLMAISSVPDPSVPDVIATIGVTDVSVETEDTDADTGPTENKIEEDMRVARVKVERRILRTPSNK